MMVHERHYMCWRQRTFTLTFPNNSKPYRYWSVRTWGPVHFGWVWPKIRGLVEALKPITSECYLIWLPEPWTSATPAQHDWFHDAACLLLYLGCQAQMVTITQPLQMSSLWCHLDQSLIHPASASFSALLRGYSKTLLFSSTLFGKLLLSFVQKTLESCLVQSREEERFCGRQSPISMTDLGDG